MVTKARQAQVSQAVEVARVKILDRGVTGDSERIRFTSAIPAVVGTANEEPGCASAVVAGCACRKSNPLAVDRESGDAAARC